MTIDVNAGQVPEWTVGDRLRKAREVTGLTQKSFAERIDVGHRTVTNYENNAVEPRMIVLKQWALLSGVPLGWIITGEAPPPSGDGASVSSLLSESNRRPFHYRSVNRNSLASA